MNGLEPSLEPELCNKEQLRLETGGNTALYTSGSTVQLYSIVLTELIWRAVYGCTVVWCNGCTEAQELVTSLAQLMNDCIIILTNHDTAACLC